MKKTKHLAMSVRDFTTGLPKEGSIGGGSLEQALIGTQAHQRITDRKMAHVAGYQREVPIKYRFRRGDYTFEVGGRIDGLIKGDDGITIEEIKTPHKVAQLIASLKSDPLHPHLLQLKTYAYMYLKNSGKQAQLRLIVVASSGKEHTEIPVAFDLDDYTGWLKGRLDELVEIHDGVYQTRVRRTLVAKNLRFPFELPRKGQDELVQNLEESLIPPSRIMVQAPTGLGKTMGVMYPVIKEALGRGEATFYVTPKNSQHEVALDGAERLNALDENLRYSTITAKAKICLKEAPICLAKYCEYAKDYYKKLYQHSILAQLDAYPRLTQRLFCEYAHRYEVCPFELSLDVTASRDIIICDYNYAFSPNASLKRFEAGHDDHSQLPNIIVDEAHNLYGRALDYFSPMLQVSRLEHILERMGDLEEGFRDEGVSLAASAVEAVKACAPENPEAVSLIEFEGKTFQRLLKRLDTFFKGYMADLEDPKAKEVVAEFVRYLEGFCDVIPMMDEDFFVTYRRDSSGRGELKINCCDGSSWLKSKMNNFANVVAFSATLKPFSFYGNLSGFDMEVTKAFEFSSPFPQQNRKILIIPQVSTKYRDRERNYSKIGDAINRIVALKRGNYFAFFPSYHFLKRVADFINDTEIKVLNQFEGMSKEAVLEYLGQLKKTGQPTLILAVQGGVFSEGIDYPGELLIGAIIVGPPLPNFNLERQLMQNYYDKSYGQGFNYAYVYPAMAKVIQSAGRVIRSERDKGLIVMLGKRFMLPTYNKTMPNDWFDGEVSQLVSSSILKDISEFWGDCD